MLIRFRFSNFRSFKDRQELSLVAGPFGDLPEVVRPSAAVPNGVLPLAAIYGANASGKTNVIRALQFMSQAIAFSYRQWEPDAKILRDPFLADEESLRVPSEFVVDVVLDGIRYQYGFQVDSEAVLEEWLHVYPKGKKQTWFHRQQGRPTVFSTKMPGENRTIENLTRKNSLFLSAAAQNNHEALLPIFKWFTNSLLFISGDRTPYLIRTLTLCGTTDYKTHVARLISAADLGITNVEVLQNKTSEQMRKVFDAIVSTLTIPPGKAPPTLPEATPDVMLLHKFGNKTIPFQKEQESNGTIAYLSLLGPAVDALKKEAVLCIDELDASIHPLLGIELMRLFNASSSNPNGAQLIFNTHDTNLLSRGVLRRDQIWFTEKNDDASSHLYPLSDFKLRREENLQNGYLQGRYGAIPFINSDSFLLNFKATNGEA